MSTPHPRPTLHQVAEQAGVSITTASRVLRHDPNVAETTRRRVQQVADALGMKPNPLAQSLRRSGTSPLIGVILPDVADPFFAQLALSIETELAHHARNIVLACHRDSATRCAQLVSELTRNRLQGLILVPAPGLDPTPLAAEIALGTAVVIVDRPLDGIEADTLVADNRTGMAALVEAVLSEGHERIALLTLDERISTQRERREAFCEVLAERVDETLIRPLQQAHAQAEGVVEELLRLTSPPTAIVSAAVPPLYGALRAVARLGSGTQLACVDDNEFFSLLPEPIIAVRQDPLRLGAIASRLIVERLGGLGEPVRRVVLPFSRPAHYGLTLQPTAAGRAVR